MHNRIKEIRKTLNLSQDEFGKKIGITNTAISKLEKGERNITEQVIISICREFNINENWFRNGEGEMFALKTIDEELAYTFGKLSAIKNTKLKEALLSLVQLSDEQLIFLNDFIKSIKGEK